MAQFHSLSKREWEVVELLLQGKSNKLIASLLGISQRTVEFHLKNIYAKFQVSSRIELILKLGNATGKVEIQNLRDSTVDRPRKSPENRDMPNSFSNWGTSFRDTISILGKELEMKNLFNTRHVPVGVITALITGFLWLALLMRFGHASPDAVKPWSLPLIIALTMIGVSVGLIGKRSGNTAGKVFLSTLFGTGLGSVVMLPLTVILVYPLGKLIEWIGLVNRSAIPDDVASALLYIAMLVFWLIVGSAVGTTLLRVSFKKPLQVNI